MNAFPLSAVGFHRGSRLRRSMFLPYAEPAPDFLNYQEKIIICITVAKKEAAMSRTTRRRIHFNSGLYRLLFYLFATHLPASL